MEVGGNAKFKEFLDRYGLVDESQNMKYSTVAADFYRRWIQSMVKGE